MLSPRNIIYGKCLTTNPPKNKYLISLYRSNDLNVVACFTTSQSRAGVPLSQVQHGKIKDKKNNVISYCFKADINIGNCPDGTSFAFSLDTTIVFDYCFQEQFQDKLLSNFEHPNVVCTLNDDEYLDLIYAMYQSKTTNKGYKTIFENILNNECS